MGHAGVRGAGQNKILPKLASLQQERAAHFQHETETQCEPATANAPGRTRAPVSRLHLAHERQVRCEHARHKRLLVLHAHLSVHEQGCIFIFFLECIQINLSRTSD